MSIGWTCLTDALDHGFDALIDVRSPAEYDEDRVPGAVNLPVLSNAERSRVGTIYTQESAFKARKIGAALVARNAARHLEGPLAREGGGWRPLVYCWRGGQRSGSFATILKNVGWRTETVDGGYRSWRRLVTKALYDDEWPTAVLLLDGNTGTAKTELLHRLAACDVQVLDLEGLGHHRGSLFGARDRAQPAQKSFETAIAGALARLDPRRPLVVEAESSKVGDLLVPPTLWAAMRTAPRLHVEAPLEARAAYLVDAYADLAADAAKLDATITNLVPIQGHARVERWRAMAVDGDHLALAAELMTHHYDPRYRAGRDRDRPPVVRFQTAALDHDGVERLADRLAVWIATSGAGAAAE